MGHRFLVLLACIGLHGSIVGTQLSLSSLIKSTPNNLRVQISAKGTGQTNGHVATVDINNDSNLPLALSAAYYFYISSDGNHQSYVVHFLSDTTIASGQSASIPVIGYCTNVHTPPVPAGESMPPFETWVAVIDPGIDVPGTVVPPGATILTPDIVVPPFKPEDIPVITATPGYTHVVHDTLKTIFGTFPGTDLPLDGTIDPDENPVVFGPVVVGIVTAIEAAIPIIQGSGSFDTPFSPDPAREKETMIQQTVWIVMGILTGEEYEEEDFTDNVYSQINEITGTDPGRLPKEEKEVLDSGVGVFWSSFVATGIEAKVMSPTHTISESPVTGPPPEKPSTPPPELVSDTCRLEQMMTCTPDTLDYDIADTGTKEMNEQSKKSFGEMVRRLSRKFEKKSDDAEVEFRLPAFPASAYSLWFPHAVGGRANATAFGIDLEKPLNSAMTTEPLKTNAKGNCEITWTHILGRDCTSTLIGINLAKVRASSGLTATLRTPEILEVVNFVGELAIDFVIKRGKGSARKLSKYLKKKVKDMAKDKAKEFVKEELKRLAEELDGKSEEEVEETLDGLLEDIKSGGSGDEPNEKAEEFLADWLAEMIIEGDDFDIEDKVEGDLLDKIDSPIDWSPIKTNTYALAEGKLDIWVEGNHDQAKAASGVRYIREEFEDREEAEKGGGTFCEGGLASAVTSGTITLRTFGEVTTMSGATGEGIVGTGHGRATATLESFNGMFVVAICECPDFTDYASDLSVTYLTNETIMGSIWKKVFEMVMNEAYEDAIKDGIDHKDFEQKLREAAMRVAASALRCND